MGVHSLGGASLGDCSPGTNNLGTKTTVLHLVPRSLVLKNNYKGAFKVDVRMIWGCTIWELELPILYLIDQTPGVPHSI